MLYTNGGKPYILQNMQTGKFMTYNDTIPINLRVDDQPSEFYIEGNPFSIVNKDSSKIYFKSKFASSSMSLDANSIISSSVHKEFHNLNFTMPKFELSPITILDNPPSKLAFKTFSVSTKSLLWFSFVKST